jgi:hypothetical protein
VAPPAPEPPAPPPVASAPPVAPPQAIALDSRSLATGVALGVGTALFAFALARGRREAGAGEAIAAAGSGPPAPEERAAEPAPAALPVEVPLPPAPPERDADLLHDILHLHHRLDERLASVAARLDEIAPRLAQLEGAGGAQWEEIAAQRVAIARLQRVLRGAPPRRPESAAGGGR